MNICKLWKNIKLYSIFVIGIPEGEERENGGEEIFEEILSENFPKVMTDSKPLIWDARRTPEKIKYQ